MLTKRYTVSCDTPACTTLPLYVEVTTASIDGPGQLRRKARDAGWQRFSGGTDACPLHVETAAESHGLPVDRAPITTRPTR